jgi:hypothetical protein
VHREDLADLSRRVPARGADRPLVEAALVEVQAVEVDVELAALLLGEALQELRVGLADLRDDRQHLARVLFGGVPCRAAACYSLRRCV